MFVSVRFFGNKKAPDLWVAGLRIKMMRSFDYARTPPEPPKGLVLVVVLAVADIMGPDLWARLVTTSTAFARKSIKARLIRVPVLRDKPLP
jgi:hypothetical protein